MASNASVGHTCPSPMKPASNGVFQGDSPLDFSLPLVILQICLVLVLTRALAFPLRRLLRQPRVIAEIIGGILLGPSALGRSEKYLHAVFPPKSLPVLDTLANIGLLYFLFLVGLELDLKSLRKTGKKALAIAIAGISLPFGMGIGSSFILRATISKGVNSTSFLLFMGVALSITAFPVLARILAELKLLTTDVGRMAMSAAAVNDVAAWILLALAIALSGSNHSPITSLWVLLCGFVFVICSTLVLPPIFKLITRRCHEGEPVEETYVCATLAAVLVAGFITDAIGIHAMFGAFVIGVLVPKEGPFARALVEKIEDLVSGLFLPLYFVSSGLKTDIATISGLQSWGLLALVTFTACFGKIVGTFLVSLACKVPLREALAMGFLMNTKGLVELIVLNIGKDKKVLNDQTFAIMVLMALFTTFITTPLVMAVYKPARKSRVADYKHRTIERKNSSMQLRILACFHSARNIPSTINLLEASRGVQKAEGLCVYAMHLMELSERSSAILMVHKARKNGLPTWNKGSKPDSNNVIVAFEAFRQLSQVMVRSMTAISSMSDIHEDICTTAERKRAAIIILPFHKHQRLDGSLETTRIDFRWVNRRVLEHAPCSVGILVDRGLGGTSHVPASDVSYLITVLFFGGRDDREALAYGARMAEHPGISLKVIRFLVAPDAQGEITQVNMESSINTKLGSWDEQFLLEFKQKTCKDSSVKYEEKAIRNTAGAMDVIHEVNHCNLFLVGRMPEGEIAIALNRWNECPELGPVGSLLATSNFSTTASVLVIQQYDSQVSLDLASHAGDDQVGRDSESY
ncbi:cation/H(+) antiporter 18 [Ricinus communis]|uniref:Na(+)/H(+) antiporter, putative n=1 Tax=Ricinus communis TaxID=3988 RepID=B9RCL0_RICCO|nr:cation/H(+) antiporter 18 [Ricinus communis]XP_048229816.1 cation/H(+) antiporter 18 [Ricinus communis]EEF51281.1 Na(+)/H(+) antiporter, putative [Ricinus communis]|eukprot:XP_002509894.1 cation/H(+) antiporter 18 [Ricinus communis]